MFISLPNPIYLVMSFVLVAIFVITLGFELAKRRRYRDLSPRDRRVRESVDRMGIR